MSPLNTKDELRGRFTRWIVVTAQNAQKNYLRTEGKRPKTISIDEIDLPIADTLPSEAETFSGSFDFAEQHLADAFRELPLMRRRILELLFVDELSPAEIAQKLHCSVQHVYNQRSLAIKRLRERLMKEREK